jgi:tRNA(Ile)-lysidine synthase
MAGFSGGPDSLALAASLQRVAEKTPLRLVAVHVDHALRDSSGAEMERAADLARVLDIPFRAHRLPRDPRQAHPGVGLEEAARRERYRAFAQIGDESGAAAVATGHHQGDQAETILLHLGRGSGLKGLAGMADDQVLSLPWWKEDGPMRQLRVWRPFLPETRTTLQRYLDGRGLVAIQDPSNNDVSLRRNQVRRHVVPALEAAFPRWTTSLERLARIVSDDDEALEQWSDQAARQITTSAGEISMSDLTCYPIAVQRRIVRRWLSASGIRPLPSFNRVDAILRSAQQGTGRRLIEIGERRFVQTRGGRLRIGQDGELAGQLGHPAGPDRDALVDGINEVDAR